MEFTKEQQDHIDNLVKQSKEGLYTEEDLNSKVTAEVDRRVESGIQKGLETQRAKWEKDYDRKAKLSAEEIAKLELQDQIDKLSEKEAEINKRSNAIDAKDSLTSAGIPKDDYNKFLDLLVSDDPDVTKKRVEDFIETFESTKKNIESTVRKELSNVPAPKGNPSIGNDEGPKDFLSMAQEANIRK